MMVSCKYMQKQTANSSTQYFFIFRHPCKCILVHSPASCCMCSNQQHLRRSKEPHSYTFSCKLAAIKNDHVFKDYVQRHLQHHVLQVPLRTYALQIASLFLSQRNNISLYWYFQKNVFLHPYRILGLNLYFRSWKSE